MNRPILLLTLAVVTAPLALTTAPTGKKKNKKNRQQPAAAVEPAKPAPPAQPMPGRPDEWHTWTSDAGTTVEAKFVALESGIYHSQVGGSYNIGNHVLVQGIDRVSEFIGEFGKGLTDRPHFGTDQVTKTFGKFCVGLSGFVIQLFAGANRGESREQGNKEKRVRDRPTVAP